MFFILIKTWVSFQLFQIAPILEKKFMKFWYFNKKKITGKPTWVSGGKIEVGEVDNIVITLLLLIEEPELSRSADNIVSDDALWREGN